ncbi:ABC transporter substrate-binding protein [Psychromonas sp. MB-3u-54]|uniref:ABC transporter substrate binding protein n=1 Tax=Psychromonas sp. MB-3u-54 TaxID=2058319 RepID=UPI000C320D4E|nr:ABC transporter substrate binding protein [Psychromonas sp. MB-3u-54]PKH04175.1 ABC transporter substrate-binding protein [Psychromonas sp. MB-3u-54]
MYCIRNVLYIFICALISFTSIAEVGDKLSFSTDPVLNDGKRWRIGYYEGGEYTDYQKEFSATVKGLMKLGWIEDQVIPAQQGENTDLLWKWLATQIKSDYIEFVSNAHYSAGWDEKRRKQYSTEVIDRLKGKQDIDLMIAMGTWAGQDLANDRHTTPTLVLSASDPLAAGIIKSVDNSGYEHLHATLDLNRFARQVKLFHELVGFKHLGIAFENSASGRSYAAIDSIEILSKERGFEIVPCYTQSDISEKAIAEASVISCFELLAKSAEAIYVTNQGGVTSNSIPKLVEIANKYRIPTFSQSGAEEVKYGFLLSLSRAAFRYLGDFHASTIAKVFNGAKPGQLAQLFEEPPKVALNLKTAKIIGFNPPLLLLGAADEIYHEIQSRK